MRKKKRFRRLSHELYIEAVEECFKDKWHRHDVQEFIFKYAGIPWYEIELANVDGRFANAREEAVESCALVLENVVKKILNAEPIYEINPVIVRNKIDGMTQKTREIALLDIVHQLLGHLAKLQLMPLFNKHIHPTQYASIPHKGQTGLVHGIRNDLNDETLGIRYFRKTDIRKAYPSLKYSKCIEFIENEIPMAKDLIKLLRYLGTLAPGGHLIIGGYLDAWLFNYMMSYAIDHLMSLTVIRRGKPIKVVKAVHTFMDDFCILGSSYKNVRMATDELSRYFKDRMGLDIKVTTGITKLLRKDEEIARKGLPRSQSHCPYIDMGGYKICRTHVNIRARVFIKIRRQFIRAQREMDMYGTIPVHRAYKVICYNGYLRNSNSFNVIKKYNVDPILKEAKKVTSAWGSVSNTLRMEELYDLQDRINNLTAKHQDRSITK